MDEEKKKKILDICERIIIIREREKGLLERRGKMMDEVSRLDNELHAIMGGSRVLEEKIQEELWGKEEEA